MDERIVVRIWITEIGVAGQLEGEVPGVCMRMM